MGSKRKTISSIIRKFNLTVQQATKLCKDIYCHFSVNQSLKQRVLLVHGLAISISIGVSVISEY